MYEAAPPPLLWNDYVWHNLRNIQWLAYQPAEAMGGEEPCPPSLPEAGCRQRSGYRSLHSEWCTRHPSGWTVGSIRRGSINEVTYHPQIYFTEVGELPRYVARWFDQYYYLSNHPLDRIVNTSKTAAYLQSSVMHIGIGQRKFATSQTNELYISNSRFAMVTMGQDKGFTTSDLEYPDPPSGSDFYLPNPPLQMTEDITPDRKTRATLLLLLLRKT